MVSIVYKNTVKMCGCRQKMESSVFQWQDMLKIPQALSIWETMCKLEQKHEAK